MTRIARIHTLAALMALVFLTGGFLLGSLARTMPLFQGGDGSGFSPSQGWALLGAVITWGIFCSAAAVYMRVFRRSPSVTVFFVILFFLFSSLDITKVGQLMIPATSWRHLSPILSRVTSFGWIAGTLALFTGGLCAGGGSLQRHGVSLLALLAVSLGLSWTVPLDSLALPEHLVYPMGLRLSVDTVMLVVLFLGVVSFFQVALAVRERRPLFTALAAAALALGRVLLFYRTEISLILLGAGFLLLGVLVFAVENYRDYLLE
ncbi:hypothetical protein AU468_07215 [Alkalispirochaeta sphaeroplastigenens]|uniref:Uncharacterized protein n=1 Tax=Alkalispirochaeta sphaeroplastigenens TaxID=1187066 RepID=A0A2S4JR87_9SPIO|nr:hypothetical protein [Alkalispirochaeta sphaeroplastigenens]POR02035.1 hypothetical protein AU468_07215 [Alkalispirochaeta sphaeroplastigenens]